MKVSDPQALVFSKNSSQLFGWKVPAAFGAFFFFFFLSAPVSRLKAFLVPRTGQTGGKKKPQGIHFQEIPQVLKSLGNLPPLAPFFRLIYIYFSIFLSLYSVGYNIVSGIFFF